MLGQSVFEKLKNDRDAEVKGGKAQGREKKDRMKGIRRNSRLERRDNKNIFEISKY